MNQISLLQITMRLQPGQEIQIAEGEIREAAGADLPALDQPARDSDVREFVEKIEKNWDLSIYQDPIRGHFTLRKVAP